MKIKKVIFEKSSSDIDSCPKTKLFEIAFIGRSNVGKSSILNMLLNKKGVAKVSKTPGKTKLINYFLVNDNLYFVDLPGYCLLYTSPSPRDGLLSRMPSSA